MATVTIGGKELRVLGADEPGSFKVDMELARIGKELSAATDNIETFRKLAELVHAYVRCNEGVTLEWLTDVLPADVTVTLKACRAACGREVVSKGEAAAPETRT